MTKRSKAMTNAQRQAAYRARKAETGDGWRLSIMVHPAVTAGLKRLSAHYQVTQAEMLLRLIGDADHDAAKRMTLAEQRAYHRVMR